MLKEDRYNGQNIQKKTRDIGKRWTELQRKMAERGDKLRQAGQQEQLMELLQVLVLLLTIAGQHMMEFMKHKKKRFQGKLSIYSLLKLNKFYFIYFSKN